MYTKPHRHLDTLNEIKVDHNNIKELYMRYKAEKDREARNALVNTIIREMALHHEAEELTVYVALEAKDYDEDAKRFRREHKEIEEELLALDHTKMDEFEYEKKFDHAITLFLHHTTEEETHPGVLANLINNELSTRENEDLAEKFIDAHELGPTVPYPYASQAGGIVKGTLGVLKKPHDKLLNKVAGGTFAELKYAHPAPGQVETLRLHEQLLQISARNLKEKSKEEEVDFKHPLKPV